MIKKSALACVLMASCTFTTSAMADTTNGQIQFMGKIVNTACGLAADSDPLVVDFGEIPASHLNAGNNVEKVDKIHLQYCDTSVATSAQIKYTPSTVNPADPSLASIVGTAAGAGIGMRDSANADVVWGTPSANLVEIVDGDTYIPFTAYIKADGSVVDGGGATVVTPGEFTSFVNFEIAYL